MAHGDPYELKFHGVAEDTYYNPTTGAIITDYARKTFTESDVVIKINGIFPRELETESTADFEAVDLHGVGAYDFEWEFENKAYKSTASDTETATSGENYRYILADKLDKTMYDGLASGSAKFCSGMKSRLSGTDLDERTIAVSYKMANRSDAQGTASYTFKLVRNSAKITFYYTPQEYGFVSEADITNNTLDNTAMSPDPENIDGVDYYFADGYAKNVKLEGAGLNYMIRTSATDKFTDGVKPSGNNKYLTHDGDKFSFGSSPVNSTGNPLGVQTVALFYKDHEHSDKIKQPDGTYIYVRNPTLDAYYRSVYNSGQTYYIEGLKDTLNGWIDEIKTDNGRPQYFINDYWTTGDAGTFSMRKDEAKISPQTRLEEEGHLDVYLAPSNGQYISNTAYKHFCNKPDFTMKVIK